MWGQYSIDATDPALFSFSAMIHDRQERVQFSFPSRLKGVDGDLSSCTLRFDTGIVSVEGGAVGRMLLRMEDAKRSRCGKFRVVFEFPAADVMIGDLEEVRHA